MIGNHKIKQPQICHDFKTANLNSRKFKWGYSIQCTVTVQCIHITLTYIFMPLIFLNTVFHEYLAGIIFSEFVILEISRVFNLAIPKNRAG